MPQESLKLVDVPNPHDIQIIGEGSVGEKAGQLVEKTAILREIGFMTPSRIVLAEGWFDDFFARNGLGACLRGVPEGIDPSEIRRGGLTTDQFATLQAISSSHDNVPLIVRSSAQGDARGTGTYTSIFTENHPGKLRKALQGVLASYFSEGAIAFRRDAQTGEGFGVMIEPVVGRWGEYFFAPMLSGFGYTSTSRGDGYVNLVPGLGGGVESRYGERITRVDVEKYGGVLDYYLGEERAAMACGYKPTRQSSLLRTETGMFEFYDYDGLGFIPSHENWRRKAEIAKVMISHEDLMDVNLLPLFNMMSVTEQRLGKPQYFEWAITVEGGTTLFWVLQVADISKKLDLIDFENHGREMFAGHTVTGSGVKECEEIVFCLSHADLDALRRINQGLSNFVLVYSSILTSRAGSKPRRLEYSDLNNASVVIELQNSQHVAGSPIEHLGGQLDLTNKLFAVLENNHNGDFWDLVRSSAELADGIHVHRAKLRVVGSERQNRLVVYEQ